MSNDLRAAWVDDLVVAVCVATAAIVAGALVYLVLLHGPEAIVSAAALAIAGALTLKLVSMSMTILWIRDRGAMYRDTSTPATTPTCTGRKRVRDRVGAWLLGEMDPERRQVLRDCGAGAVWPWGVRDFRVYDGSTFVKVGHAFVYRLNRLVTAAVILLLALGSRIDHHSGLEWAIWALIYLPQVALLLFAAEAVASHTVLGNYIEAFHRTRMTGASVRLAQLRLVLRTALLNVLASAAAMYALERLDAGRYLIDGGLRSSWRGVGQALYFATSTATTVGYGDIHPISAGAQLSAVLTQVTSFAVLGLFLNAVLDHGEDA